MTDLDTDPTRGESFSSCSEQASKKNHAEDGSNIVVAAEHAGKRLDSLLADTFRPRYSRTYFQYLISEGLVLVNGQPVKKRVQPQLGDEIEVEFALLPELKLQAQPIPLNILYEDEHLLAVNKAAGMVVHPAAGNWDNTFVNALLWHCREIPLIPAGEPGDKNSVRPGIVHRLDKDTSGVLIAAKTLLAQQKLIELFAKRGMQKDYWAIVCGNPPASGTLNGSIGRHPVQRQMMTVVNTGGKPAVSHYQKAASNGNFSLLHVAIETGRTHQIRVHLKHAGFPVLGDIIYGNQTTNQQQHAERQMLHAYQLQFVHPINGKSMKIIAPPPADFVQQMEKIKRLNV